MAQATTIYLSLGSNVGDRAAQIARAVELPATAGLRMARQSALYATEPVDFSPQNWFLNCVLEAETELMPHSFSATSSAHKSPQSPLRAHDVGSG